MKVKRIHWAVAIFVMLSIVPRYCTAQDFTSPAKIPSEYTSVFGSLHAHTSFSDGDVWNRKNHAPSDAFRVAQKNGLDVLAITDHAELLSPLARNNTPQKLDIVVWEKVQDWNSQESVPKEIPSRNTPPKWNTTEQLSKTLDLYTHQHPDPNEWNETLAYANHQNRIASENHSGGLIALRGFEWSGDDYSDAHGHINIIGTPSYIGQHTMCHDKDEVHDLQGLYMWVSKVAGDNPELPFVCQFNHPNLYQNLKDMSMSAPFRNFSHEWLPTTGAKFLTDDAVDKHFALMELGTHSFKVNILKEKLQVITYWGPRCPFHGITNESLYLTALSYGWHLAPTMNGDNHDFQFGAEPQRTGIWVTKKTPDEVMNALIQRRVFATEHPGFRLMVTCQNHPMGSRLSMMDIPMDTTGIHQLTLQVDADGTHDEEIHGHFLGGEKIAWVDLIAGKRDAYGAQYIQRINVGTTNTAHLTFRYYLNSENLHDVFPDLQGKSDYYFFVRVVQKRNSVIYYSYSAPIWITQN